MLTPELINIGKISGVFGVKGWVKVYSLTDPRENILDYSPWIIKKGNEVKEIKLVNGKRQGKSIVVCIDGVSDRDAAETYNNWEIFVSKEQFPETEEGEYYWADLIDLQVETEQGMSLGKVDHLIETGANDVLIVKSEGEERLIPFIQGQVIKRIDLESHVMIVDWDPDF